MKKFILSGALSLIFMGAIIAPVHAETTASTTDTTTSSMMEQIKALMTQLKSLQEQLAQLKGEIKTLKDGLHEGMTDADIAKIQELLATDSSIYPEGKITGYFGPLTKNALMRFQMRHGATSTGEIDAETRDLLEEYLHEGFGDKIPQGLLRAPGIMKKVEDRFRFGCDVRGGGAGMGPLCKKFHAGDKKNDGNDNENDNNDHENSTTTNFDVTVKIIASSTKLSFTFNGHDYTITVDSTNRTDVLDAAAEAITAGDTASDLDADLADAIKTALNKALANEKIVTRSEARTAITDAENAITHAQDAIDAATGSTTDAEALLSDAQDKLDAAQNKFDDRKYADAKKLAGEAKGLAQDAEDAL